MQGRRFVQHAYIGDYSQGTEADLKLFHLRYQLKIARDRRYFFFLAIPAAMSDSVQAENAPNSIHQTCVRPEGLAHQRPEQCCTPSQWRNTVSLF